MKLSFIKAATLMTAMTASPAFAATGAADFSVTSLPVPLPVIYSQKTKETACSHPDYLIVQGNDFFISDGLVFRHVYAKQVPDSEQYSYRYNPAFEQKSCFI